MRENRLWQSLQECRASFVSTQYQLPFTCTVPVCTYVRRARAEQGSLAVNTSFGIVYTRAFAGDKVSAYAISVCVWMVGEAMEKVEERGSGGVEAQKVEAKLEARRSCGWRSGVCLRVWVE